MDLLERIELATTTVHTESLAFEALAEARDEIERLRAALLKYGSHEDNCRSRYPYTNVTKRPECDCGWRETLEAARVPGVDNE